MRPYPLRFVVAQLLAAAILLPLGLAAHADEARPPEPSGYRLDAYRAPTPATLDGAPGLTTPAAHDLWSSKEAAFIDVLPQPPRPAGLAPGTVWHPKRRDDIPGSVWLPDTGYGVLAEATEAYFKAGLAAATHADKERPLVFYCLRNCWMSWNAAKRARTFGYRHVLWYPEGTEGWSAAGLPLKERQPEPGR